MVEGTKIDPKIPDDEEDSLDLKSSKVKEEDDAVFLFPSIASLKNLFVEYICLYIYIYIYIFNNHLQRKTFPRKEKWRKKVFADSQTKTII